MRPGGGASSGAGSARFSGETRKGRPFRSAPSGAKEPESFSYLSSPPVERAARAATSRAARAATSRAARAETSRAARAATSRAARAETSRAARAETSRAARAATSRAARAATSRAARAETSRAARAETSRAARAETSRAARAESDLELVTAGLLPRLPTRISCISCPVADLILAFCSGVSLIRTSFAMSASSFFRGPLRCALTTASPGPMADGGERRKKRRQNERFLPGSVSEIKLATGSEGEFLNQGVTFSLRHIRYFLQRYFI